MPQARPQTPTRSVSRIVIHCSDTPDGRPNTVEDIDSWHRERGFRRLDRWRRVMNSKLTSIGYHFVIYVNGAIVTGRSLEEVGAHVQGYNGDSVGVCVIGRGRYSLVQWAALKSNVNALMKKYPEAAVVGHRDLDRRKLCPCFDVRSWVAAGMVAPHEHVLRQEAAP
ncbi:putative N-acetylmuramoyl-L-alanine amidase [Microcystis phage Mae-JY22]